MGLANLVCWDENNEVWYIKDGDFFYFREINLYYQGETSHVSTVHILSAASAQRGPVQSGIHAQYRQLHNRVLVNNLYQIQNSRFQD